MSGSVSLEAAMEAKRDGQDVSLLDLMADDEDAFMDAVRALAPGAAFTANTLRPALDRAQVPESKRAALMRAACAKGLAEPVTFNVAGQEVAVKVPSTGRSAKGAYVCLYRRPTTHPEGR